VAEDRKATLDAVQETGEDEEVRNATNVEKWATLHAIVVRVDETLEEAEAQGEEAEVQEGRHPHEDETVQEGKNEIEVPKRNEEIKAHRQKRAQRERGRLTGLQGSFISEIRERPLSLQSDELQSSVETRWNSIVLFECFEASVRFNDPYQLFCA